jgi:hypothetical protein
MPQKTAASRVDLSVLQFNDLNGINTRISPSTPSKPIVHRIPGGGKLQVGDQRFDVNRIN